MTYQEQYIAQRNDEIKKLSAEMKRLLKRAIKISKLPPPKRWQTSMVRAARAVQLGIRARMILTQIQIIASQPIPKKEFPKGGPAIVGEKDFPELVQIRN